MAITNDDLIEGFDVSTKCEGLTKEQAQKFYDYLRESDCKLDEFKYSLEGIKNMAKFMACGLDYERYPEANSAIFALADAIEAISKEYERIHEAYYDAHHKRNNTFFNLFRESAWGYKYE